MGSAVSPASVVPFQVPPPFLADLQACFLGEALPPPLLLCSVRRNTSQPRKKAVHRRVFSHFTNQISKHWRPWFFTLFTCQHRQWFWRCCSGADSRDQPPSGRSWIQGRRVSVGGGSHCARRARPLRWWDSCCSVPELCPTSLQPVD